MGDRRRRDLCSCSPGRSRRSAPAPAAATPAAGPRRCSRAGRVAGHRGRARCASCTSPDEGAQLAAGRGAGRADDQPRLGADHAPGRRAGHRRRRHDLPRRDRRAASSACPASSAPRTATTMLRDGELVTVDGAAGTVLEGDRRGAARGRDRATAPGAGVAEPSSRWRPGSTSTWPSPSTPRRSPRCRSTASACCAPSSCSPTRSAACTRASCSPRAAQDEFVDRDVGVAAADHPRVRAAAGRLPDDRLPHQRVPRPRGRRRVRAASRRTR